MIISKPIFNKPQVYADYNIWGTKLNKVLDLQDNFNGEILGMVKTLIVTTVDLEKNKVSIKDVPKYVTPVMDNYMDNTIKPELDDYTLEKEKELDAYTKDILKVDLRNETNSLKTEIEEIGSAEITLVNESVVSANKVRLELDTSIEKGNSAESTLKAQNTESLKTMEIAKETEKDLNLSIQKGNTATTEIEAIVEKGETVQSKLEVSIPLADKAITKLDEAVKLGEQTQTNLESSIKIGDTSKVNLDSSISKSATSEKDLEKVIVVSTQSQAELQSKINEVPTLIVDIQKEGNTQVKNVTAEGDKQIERIQNTGGSEDKLDKGGYEGTAQDLDTEIKKVNTLSEQLKKDMESGGYTLVTNPDQDIPMMGGSYYEIVDSLNHQYSVHVDEGYGLPESDVIEDSGDFIRMQGVEMPCKLAIRSFPTLSGNTMGISFLEFDSNFGDNGSSTGIKHLRLNGDD